MLSRIAACLCVVFVSGCTTEHFRAETVLLPDGSVDRVIWQSLDKEQHTQWQEVHRGIQDERLQSELWELADNPRPKAVDGKPDNLKDYDTTARGHFKSAEQIPNHYRREAPSGLPDAILKRKAERDDFVFITEHRWEETLTDCVQLEDIPVARRVLVDLVVPAIMQPLREELGADYDVSAVEPWLRGEGAMWFDELSALYLELGATKSLNWDSDKAAKERAEKRSAAIHHRHGLANTDHEIVEKFASNKVRKLIKRRDGTALDDELVATIVRWATLQREAEGQPENRFERRTRQWIEATYGSEEFFREQCHARFACLIGVHHPFQASQEFDYRLTVPGFVVETTGELTSDNRVRWRFHATDAFPLGYAMRCRSLQPNEANQRAVFNDVILKSHSDCERLVRLLKAKPDWRKTLATCVTEKSRQPLFDLRKKVQNRNDFKERLQFEDLESLLQLAPQF
ncbi:MAG: hypothetical protein IAG10_02220 [Planctomycetaceae bacterium]|nr:hypothetical protein [Planctomycetaceae bacterium]